jgi:hypothetical protein
MNNLMIDVRFIFWLFGIFIESRYFFYLFITLVNAISPLLRIILTIYIPGFRSETSKLVEKSQILLFSSTLIPVML